MNRVGTNKVGNAYPSIIVVGLGKTGYSCARYLAARGETFIAMDTRDNPPYLQRLKAEQPDTPVLLGPLDEAMLCGADRLILSPGVALSHPAIAAAKAAGVQITSDIDLFCEVVETPIIAITGSNAKSTVTTLVGLMAECAGKRVAVGGNLGTPVLELAERLTGAEGEPFDCYVLELSSFQLETAECLRADVAALLNLSPDHMDRYVDLEDYLRAKQRIFRGCRWAVVNRDEPQTHPLLAAEVKVSGFGLEPPATGDFGLLEQDGIQYLAKGEQRLIPAADLKIKGRHNLANALASLAIGDAAGFALPPMLEALRRFEGLPHRCQWVREWKGVNFYNDSKGTNVGAAVAAVVGLGASGAGKVVLIAGGDGKGADFAALKAPVLEYCSAVVLLGRDADRIEQALASSAAEAPPLLRAESLQEAVQMAAAQALSGDLVLLSPACASFDMFDNFEARGEVFMQAVRALS